MIPNAAIMVFLLAHLIIIKNEYYLKCGWSVHFNTLNIHIQEHYQQLNTEHA